MKLTIIIPTKDRGAVFAQTLRQAIIAIDDTDAEIIVVNDSKTSIPSTPEHKKVKLINNAKSGVASARNAGARESKGKVLLFLDDDIVISNNTVVHILKLHDDFPNACFNLNWEYPVSLKDDLNSFQFGRFIEHHQLTSFKGWYRDSSWKDDALFSSKSVASFHLSISRENFERTQGYNEEFPHAGFEDYDFPLRLKDAQVKLYIDTRVLVYHNEIDRIKIENWLDSQKNRSKTRNVAVTLGYTELRLHYGILKKIILSGIVIFSSIMVKILKIIPNNKIFDPIYFKFVDTLIAGKIYEGYTASKK